MNSQRTQSSQRWWLSICAFAMVLCTLPVQPAMAFSAVRLEFPNMQIGFNTAAAAAPGFLGRAHGVATRTDRVLGRVSAMITSAAAAWLWILPSAAFFFVVVAVASATDLRMLDLRRQTLQMLARDLGHGVRTFFGVLRDRQTRYLPRGVLALALLYWLLPTDLVGDGTPAVGMLDDLVVAILAAKLFIHLCPDAVVAAHAAAVRAPA